MFKKGDRVHLHDGTAHVMKTDGIPPRAGRRSRKALGETMPIRGFVRGALVDCVTGETKMGEWHENVVTTHGHKQIVYNFAGLAGSGPAQWWGIGNYTAAATQASDLSILSSMHSEYGTASNSAANANGAQRAQVSASQALAGTWTLSQSWAYPSSQISNNVVLNCLAQYHGSTISGTQPALSLALFASSSKSNSQALNITYNWAFGTALLIAIALYAMMDKLEMLFY